MTGNPQGATGPTGIGRASAAQGLLGPTGLAGPQGIRGGARPFGANGPTGTSDGSGPLGSFRVTGPPATFAGGESFIVKAGRWGPVTRKQRKPRQAPSDGLKTAAQAAAKLGCSIKTLKGHIKAGELKYVALGSGRVRRRRMFTDADLDEFIANQTRKDQPACPSSRTPARHSGASTSNAKVIAFTAQPKPGHGGKRKR